MTTPTMVLSFRSGKANTNVNTVVKKPYSWVYMFTAKIAGHVKSAVSLMSFFFV